MDGTPRRCYSEHGASSSSKTVRLAPSHVATKIRKAQLRQTKASQLLPRASRIVSPTFLGNVNRNLSAFPFSLRLPQPLPSWGDIQTSKKQLDGADNFPLIDTVIADPIKDSDKTRTMAETEFYEHTDLDGVARRRSIMRTVNKDDCLRGRGANPRTGMVTPDVYSLAGSSDYVAEQREQTKLPSAQWKLRDNQWISEIQDEDKGIHLPEQDIHQATEAQAQPLTSNNLRTFSNSVLEDRSTHRLLSPSTEAILNVRKIRRKPIGGPSKASNVSNEPYTQRSVSEDTVIHTPPIEKILQNNTETFCFFSPDDVERVRRRNKPTVYPNHLHDRLPFLGQLAKPRTMNHTQGFASGTAKSLRLEKCLRMNGGPYPSPASVPQSMTERPRTENPRAFLPAAPRAYLSDLATTGIQSQEQTLRPAHHATHQNRSLRRQESIVTATRNVMANDLSAREKEAKSGTSWSPETSLNTTTLTYREQINSHDIRQMQEDQSSSKRCTSPKGDLDIPNGHLKGPLGPPESHTDLGHITSTAKRRPALGTRTNATIGTSKDLELTRTAQQSPLSLTGMSNTKGEEVAEVTVRAPAADAVKTDLPYRTGSDTSIDLSSVASSNALSPELDLHDHSTCCPKCCVEFNCHAGCLGHSPQGEVDKSETSSLPSVGIFDASFETSVKAINEVLLTPQDKRGSALAKLRQAFTESIWHVNSSLTRESAKQKPLKRTLRRPSPVRGQPIISDPVRKTKTPRVTDVKQAKVAAAKAMGANSTANRRLPQGPQPAKSKDSWTRLRKASTIIDSHTSKNEANECRKVSAATFTTQLDTIKDNGHEKDEDIIESDVDDVAAKSARAESVIGKIEALVLSGSISNPLLACRPTMLEHGPALFGKWKEITMITLDTMTILLCIIYDYKRTGRLVIPGDVSLTELMGNCLRALLHLMIAACIYALLVEISRVALCVLRILLLPVRLCAWVVG